MKKTLITILVAALVITPLVLAGCGCGGSELSKEDIAVIQADHNKLNGYVTRLDDAEADISTIRGVTDKLDADTLATLEALAKLDADTLGKLAELEEDELEALLTLQGWQDDLKDPNKDGSLADLEERIEALESGSSSSTTPPVTSGQVTVAFTPTPPAVVSGSGLPIQQFNVVITNGTAAWQYVSYSLILTVKASPPTTGATVADLDGTNSGTPMGLTTSFSSSFAFTYNFVTNTSGQVTQITIYPVHGVAVGPGVSSSSILNYLSFNLPSGVAVQEWNCTILPVYSTSSW
jgi:outer membrane lipoprotein-sorting protein